MGIQLTLITFRSANQIFANMKNKLKKWLVVLLMAVMLCCILRQSSGQGKVSLAAGVGLPELINIGLRYQLADQAKAGFSVGWWPPSQPGWFSWGHLFSISGDFFIHFGGSSELTELRPWFARIGINYVCDSDEPWFLPVYLRIGRELNLDTDNGLSIDAGAGYNINHNATGVTPVMPVVGVSYFHRF